MKERDRLIVQIELLDDEIVREYGLLTEAKAITEEKAVEEDEDEEEEKPEKPTRKKADVAAGGKKIKVDVGGVRALYFAGWDPEKIADEHRIPVEAVQAVIKQMYKEQGNE
jgi:hypothetical protein